MELEKKPFFFFLMSFEGTEGRGQKKCKGEGVGRFVYDWRRWRVKTRCNQGL